MRRIAATVCLLAILTNPCTANPEKPPIAEALGLKAAPRDGATVYHDPALKDHVEIAATFYRRLVEAATQERAIRTRLLDHADAIIGAVNRITASEPTEAERTRQREVLSRFLTTRPMFEEGKGPVRVYLVSGDKVKDYLRRGGTLPGCAYDKATDTASFQLSLDLAHGPPDAAIDLLLPVGDMERAEEDLRDSCDGIIESVRPLMFAVLALHEVVECTLVHVRLKPRHAYWRWFSDGMANALAEHLAGEFLGADVAASAAEAFSAAPYRDLKEEVNLAWWLASDHSAFEGTSSMEAEGRLRHARYAFATEEAKRLVKAHGLECVPKILDAGAREEANSRLGLVAAVSEVTGDDMAARLGAYQTFETAKEGWAKYERACLHARARKDAAEAASAMLRLRELAEHIRPDCDVEAAYLLFAAGYEAEADRFLEKRMTWLAERKAYKPLVVMKNFFCTYALRTKRPEKAYTLAEELLETDSDAVAPLRVRMDRLIREKRLDEAKAVARRLAELERQANESHE